MPGSNALCASAANVVQAINPIALNTNHQPADLKFSLFNARSLGQITKPRNQQEDGSEGGFLLKIGKGKNALTGSAVTVQLEGCLPSPQPSPLRREFTQNGFRALNPCTVAADVSRR